MKVTIETDEIHAKKMLSSIQENKDLRLSVETYKIELYLEKEKYKELVRAIQDCTNVWSNGGLYYDDSNKDAQDLIRNVL